MRFFWNGKWESFVVLAPQLSTAYGNWPTFYAEEMIQYAKQNLQIDHDRIILTGLSLGGGGAWAYPSQSLQNAQNLAALGVVCGVSGGYDACNISKAKLPVWAFHASDDKTVSISNTNNTINKIISCNNPVEPVKTIWPTGGHGIWDRAYDKDYKWQNPNIYEWFLGQNRSLPVNVRPKAYGGKNITVSKLKGQIQLSGALSKDSDGKIVRFIWAQLSGPVSTVLSKPVSEDGITNVTGLTVPGLYQFLLKAIDDRAEYSFHTISVTVQDGAVPNIAPIPHAGEDLEIATTRTFLSGCKCYDPDGKIISYQWI